MDEISQKPTEVVESKTSIFRNTILLAGLFFVIGVLLSGAFVFWSQKQVLKAALGELKQCTELKAVSDKSKVDVSKPIINWNSRLLLSKDYGKFNVGAFTVGDLIGDVFIVAPIENGQPTIYINSPALSYADDAFLMDNLFDIVGDKIYVLNQNRGFIDIYSASYSERTMATSAYYSMNYLGSINGPRYKVGVPYSIKCQDNKCQLQTAFHQEAGCDMELNLETKQYSGIKCSDIGGDINLEPL